MSSLWSQSLAELLLCDGCDSHQSMSHQSSTRPLCWTHCSSRRRLVLQRVLRRSPGSKRSSGRYKGIARTTPTSSSTGGLCLHPAHATTILTCAIGILKNDLPTLGSKCCCGFCSCPAAVDERKGCGHSYFYSGIYTLDDGSKVSENSANVQMSHSKPTFASIARCKLWISQAMQKQLICVLLSTLIGLTRWQAGEQPNSRNPWSVDAANFHMSGDTVGTSVASEPAELSFWKDEPKHSFAFIFC